MLEAGRESAQEALCVSRGHIELLNPTFPQGALLREMAAPFWGRDAVRPLLPVGERGDDRLSGAVFHSKSAPCARAPVHETTPCNHLLAPCCFLPEEP